MANYLLDTHAIIWFFEESEELTDFGHETIRNYQNSIYISIATLWEMAVKINIGKLNLGVSLHEFSVFCLDNNIQILPIQVRYLTTYTQLPLLHKDPFDRLIIANAITDNMKIFTKDAQIQQYNVSTTW